MRRYLNVFVVLTLATLSRAQVRGWEGRLVLPTYEEGMPDPNPPFDRTNVRQVWVEVELQKMLASARDGHCTDALVVAEHLGAPQPDLPFTHDGLEPTLQSARTNYDLGAAYASCAKPEEAAKKFRLASAASAPDQIVWAWRAAQKLPGFDGKQWQERLQAALAQAKSRSDTSSHTSWWDYTAGALAGALGSQQEADQRFQKALVLPDRMLSYHFTRARHPPKLCRCFKRSVRSNQWTRRNIRVAVKHELGMTRLNE